MFITVEFISLCMYAWKSRGQGVKQVLIKGVLISVLIFVVRTGSKGSSGMYLATNIGKLPQWP